MSRLELRIPPLALVMIVAFGMWLLAQLVPAATIARPVWWMALVPALAGGLFAFAGVAAFRRARTTVNPVTPQATSAIVTTGVYRHSRNPMYVGFLLVLTGWGIYLGNLCAALLLPLFIAYMNRFQIAPEERALSAKFGSGYADYMRRVRRWL